MKKNSAFFQQKVTTNSSSSASISLIIKNGRYTGSMKLSNCELTELPFPIVDNNFKTDEGDKVWEMVPLHKLDLSFNKIASLPIEIKNLLELESLKLRGNQLINLPRELYQLNQLEHLDVAQNQLQMIFTESIQNHLLQLKELILFENQLQTLSKSINQCQNLISLDVKYNQLNDISDLYLPCCQRLDLSYNKLNQLPKSLASMKQLEWIDCQYNFIESIPNLNGLTLLTYLNLMSNRCQQLPILPDSLNTKLNYFNIGMNALTGDLSMTASQFSEQFHLIELHLSNNHIQSIPTSFGLLPNLKLLDISNNDISDVPYLFGYNPSLQKLLLHGNPIRSIRHNLLNNQISNNTNNLKIYLRSRGPPPGNKQDGHPHHPSHPSHQTMIDDFQSCSLDEKDVLIQWIDSRIRDMEGNQVDLSSHELTDDQCSPKGWVDRFRLSHLFDVSMGQYVSFHLNLSNNQLKSIPKCLESLYSLLGLNLKRNLLHHLSGLDRLHCPLPSLPHLQQLELSENRLNTAQFQWITGGLIHLTILIATGNQMENLPKSIESLTQLRELRVGYNRIVSLDNLSFQKLIALEILDVSNNQIHSVGKVWEAVKLTVLQLENNQLADIPPNIGKLQYLRALEIYGNPQKSIRNHVMQKGISALLDILRSRMTAETVEKEDKLVQSSVNTMDRSQSSVMSLGNHLEKSVKYNGYNSNVENYSKRFESQTAEDKLRSLENELENEWNSISNSRRNQLRKEIALLRTNLIRKF